VAPYTSVMVITKSECYKRSEVEPVQRLAAQTVKGPPEHKSRAHTVSWVKYLNNNLKLQLLHNSPSLVLVRLIRAINSRWERESRSNQIS